MRLNPFDKVMHRLPHRLRRLAAVCAVFALLFAVLAPVQHPANDTDLGQNLIVLSMDHANDAPAGATDMTKPAHSGCATYMDLARSAEAPQVALRETTEAFSFPVVSLLRSEPSSSPFKPPRA